MGNAPHSQAQDRPKQDGGLGVVQMELPEQATPRGALQPPRGIGEGVGERYQEGMGSIEAVRVREVWGAALQVAPEGVWKLHGLDCHWGPVPSPPTCVTPPSVPAPLLLQPSWAPLG